MLLSFHVRSNSGLGLLGLRGQEALGEFWPHQQCPLWVTELLTAGGCSEDVCSPPVFLRKHCCPVQPGRLLSPLLGSDNGRQDLSPGPPGEAGVSAFLLCTFRLWA